MHKTILAFNFSAERLKALKLISMMLRVQLRAVARSEMAQPVGFLAGVPGVESAGEAYAGEEAQQEMLVLCAFTRPDLDRLLAAIKKSSLREVALKAMLTPHNAQWSALKLQAELAAEHNFMHDKKHTPKPQHKAEG